MRRKSKMNVKIKVTPELIANYNDAREKGYTGSLSDFIDETVKAFIEMRSR